MPARQALGFKTEKLDGTHAQQPKPLSQPQSWSFERLENGICKGSQASMTQGVAHLAWPYAKAGMLLCSQPCSCKDSKLTAQICSCQHSQLTAQSCSSPNAQKLQQSSPQPCSFLSTYSQAGVRRLAATGPEHMKLHGTAIQTANYHGAAFMLGQTQACRCLVDSLNSWTGHQLEREGRECMPG